MKRPRIAILQFLMSLIGITACAQWQPTGILICDTLARFPQVAPDGSGGVYVCWQDLRNGDRDLYAQRVDSAGNLLWQENGVLLVRAPGDQFGQRAINDGRGNAIVVWTDNRSITQSEIYAQKISMTGQVQWALTGVKVAEGGGLPVSIAADGNGGVGVGWETGYDVFVQRLDSTGARMWGDSGVQVTNRPGPIYPNDIWLVSDSNRGVIVAWAEGESYDQAQVYIQRVDSTGSIRWQANGIAISTTECKGVAACSDNQGGAIVSWDHTPQGTMAQSVDSLGSLRWTNGGILLGNSSGGGGQRNNSDGASGAIVGHGIYIQHINQDGTKLWSPDGVRFTQLPIPGIESVQVPTHDGGMWNFWTAYPSTSQIYGQWIDGQGEVRWGVDGRPISTASVDRAHAVADGKGEAFVAWSYTVGNGSVWLAKVDTNGVITATPEEHDGQFPRSPTLYQNYPNPFNPTTTIRYTLSDPGFVSLRVYDLLGREVRRLVDEVQHSGSHSAVFDATGLASGIYFYKLQAGGFTAVKRMVIVK